MPTAATNSYNAQALVPLYNPETAKIHHVKLPVSITYVKGQVLAQITATGVFSAYVTAGAGGLEIARAILQYDVVTDASGNVTIGGGERGASGTSAPAYFSGCFKTSELTDLDAAAVVDFGRLLWGSVADGCLQMMG